MAREIDRTQESVYQLLVKGFSPLSDYKVVQEDLWVGLRHYRFDMVVYRKNDPLVVVEVKRGIEVPGRRSSAQSFVESALEITKARYGLVTDDQLFYFIDRSKNEGFKLIDFDDFVTAVTQYEFIDSSRLTDRATAIIDEVVRETLSENDRLKGFIKSKTFKRDIIFDSDSNTLRIKDNGGGLKASEHQFFQTLLGSFQELKVCRYTSLNSLYNMLNNESFRMSGVNGMNDRSEVNFVDNYLDGIDTPIDKLSISQIKELNDRYITSCTKIDKKDDLTMWRLYADDCTGVCLTFDVVYENVSQNTILQYVKYADSKGHLKELEFLKTVMQRIETELGFPFVFDKLKVWRHFFKPCDYAIEEEIRLLVIDDEELKILRHDWVMTHSHSVFNPIIDFRLNDDAFPIQLSEVLLGPKSPEQLINKVQIAELMRRKNLSGIKVELSGITHYR